MPSRSSIIPQVAKNNPASVRQSDAAPGRQGPALGTYGNNSSPSGKSIAPVPVPVALVERYRLQSHARALLPLEGVAGCLRRRQAGKEAVDLWYLPEASRARFGGLQTCCSVWACPVCSAKITERRRVEVREAIDAWNAMQMPPAGTDFDWHPPMAAPGPFRGGEVVMASFTVRHKSTDKLKALVRGLRRALGRLSAGKEGQKLRSLYGVMGMVRSVEVTWGEKNGFHPHVHMLIFVQPGCQFDLLWLHLRKQWDSALRLEGMREVTERGVDLRWANEDAADYVTKNSWDIEHEIAKGPMKQGREDSLTPPQLLRLHADAPGELDKDTGELRWSRWGRLWREYAHEMKGVHQLQWTPRFRASIGLKKEKTEEVLAAETDKLGILLARLDKKEWATILYFDSRAELLNVAASGDTLEVKAFLFDLDCRFRSSQEELEVKRSERRATEWDERKEADADEMGLTRAEYIAWRSSGAAGLVNDAPTALPDAPAALPDGPVKGNSSTLRAMVRRVEREGLEMIAFESSVGPLRWGSAPAFCLPKTLEKVEPSEKPDFADEPRNGFSERFAGIT